MLISGNAEPALDRLNPNHIILATDFSARCDRAQDRAVQLAIEWNATLTAVHALSDIGLTTPPSLREAYRTAAMRNAGLLRQELASTEGLRSSVVVEEGPVEAVILAAVAKERAELIVAGIGRTGPLAQVLIGSNATALARTSPVPLLVVKKKVLHTDARIAVATDLSDSSKPALRLALQWFSLRYLTLFHAFDPPYRGWVDDRAPFDRQFEASAIAQCRSFVQDVAGENLDANFDIIVRCGDPVTWLRVLSNEADFNLVVAGTHGRTGLMQILLGSVASRVVNEVPSDVLVVPSRPH
ncbi:nucleotide-binding universal stress UspA family protein [Rhizobium azibense]|uniref:Nucleotide-binding universal stress UspA family protein n=1 Tax=Rhizobium azibense TaxID=1136135 RepID=A0A4R3S9Z6_9HYPH|nr:universal stress protein [Rhizobium azibense]TCU30603.1 nucleotide-binding universal stress UspA family protein [Rhizobium azibense]TCU41386.1 nucleotide-binding universal stress UspA family protein [Rhizobium azibense]